MFPDGLVGFNPKAIGVLSIGRFPGGLVEPNAIGVLSTGFGLLGSPAGLGGLVGLLLIAFRMPCFFSLICFILICFSLILILISTIFSRTLPLQSVIFIFFCTMISFSAAEHPVIPEVMILIAAFTIPIISPFSTASFIVSINSAISAQEVAACLLCPLIRDGVESAVRRSMKASVSFTLASASDRVASSAMSVSSSASAALSSSSI